MRLKWKIVSVLLDIVLVLHKIGARFVTNVPSAQKSFWTHPIVLIGDGAQLVAYFGPFGDSVNLDAR